MSKLEEAKELLTALQVPTKQQNNMCCCVLLAMANITENMTWTQATNGWIRIHDVIAFANDNYSITYAENSRETIRKQAMHHFRNAALGLLENNIAAKPENRDSLTDYIKALHNMKASIATSNEAVQNLKETSLKNQGIERTMIQSIRFLDADLSSYIEMTEQICKSIDRIIDKSKFVVGSIDFSGANSR